MRFGIQAIHGFQVMTKNRDIFSWQAPPLCLDESGLKKWPNFYHSFSRLFLESGILRTLWSTYRLDLAKK